MTTLQPLVVILQIYR